MRPVRSDQFNSGQVGWNREYIDLLSNGAISRSYLDLLAHRAVLAEKESLAIDRLDCLIGAAMVTIFRRGIRKTWNGANPFDRGRKREYYRFVRYESPNIGG